MVAALEGHLPLVVGNPNHMRNLRGQKTDRKDAKWISGLVRHGLIRPSYVPEVEFRDARELTRCRRQLIQARTQIRNEVIRLLAHQGIQLGGNSLLSNPFGVSGMGILEALAEGRDLGKELPGLLYKTVKGKAAALAAALEAGLREVERALLTMHLGRLEAAGEDIQRVEQLIEAYLAPHRESLALLMSIPGVSWISACVLVAEIGVDVSHWPSAEHLSAWGGVAPGCKESAGKSRKAAVRKGNPYVCTTLVECAGAAAQVKQGPIADLYRRLCARTGSRMKAKVAIARHLLVILYDVLHHRRPYQEPASRLAEPARRSLAIQKHLHAMEHLGYHVPDSVFL